MTSMIVAPLNKRLKNKKQLLFFQAKKCLKTFCFFCILFLMNKRKTSHQLEWAIAILASISTILGTLIVLYQFCEPQMKTKTRRADLRKATLRSISDKDILVLVAPFESEGSLKFDVAGRIIEKLHSAFEEIPELRVEFYPDSISEEDPYAIGNLGWRLGAFILIQGAYDDAGIRPRFLLPRTFPSALSDTLPFLHHDHAIAWEIGLMEHSPTDSLILISDGKAFEDFPLLSEDLAEYIRRGLPEQMIYLVGLTGGMRLYRLGEFEKAFLALNQCIAHGPSSSLSLGLASAYFYRGRIFESQNQFENAIKDFTKVLEYDSGHFGAYLHRARMDLQFKQCDLAFHDCERAKGVFEKPNPFLFHWIYPPSETEELDFLYGKTLACTGKDSMAIFYIKQFLNSIKKKDPVQLAMASEVLGEIYLRGQRYWEAMNAFQTAMAWDSTRARIYRGLGISVWETRHDTVRAVRFFQRYFALETDTSSLSETKRKYGFLFSKEKVP